MSFIGMNGVFMPMFLAGLAGVSRGSTTAGELRFAQPHLGLNVAALVRMVPRRLQLIFSSISSGAARRVKRWTATRGSRRPWNGRRLRRRRTATSTCAGHLSWTYDYSVPGHSADFTPQTQEA